MLPKQIFSAENLPLLLDGATGTQLFKAGLPQGICVEKWILEHKDVLLKIQQDYVKAGSDCIYAPTFGANRLSLSKYGLADEVIKINTGLVALSKSAGARFVGGDMSPTGQMLLPYGDLEFDQLIAVYKEQAMALHQAEVDFFVIETMMSLSEVRAAVLAVKEVSDKPVIVTVTVDENGRTLSGNSVMSCLCTLQEMGIDAFGINCSTGPFELLAHIAKVAQYAKIPLIAKPNAGVPDAEGKVILYSPEDFALFAKSALKKGIGILGGCCGTEDSHIRAMKEILLSEKYFPPVLDDTVEIIATTEKEAFFIHSEFDKSEALKCTDDLPEEILEAEESGCDVITVEINSTEELETFFTYSYMFSLPVCILTDSYHVLETAARQYCGRLMTFSTENIDEEKLQPLEEKYGLIII